MSTTAADLGRGLRADLRLRRGALDLELTLRVRPGEVLALLGPNGAGKTSTLRALAGLDALTSGTVSIDDAVLEDTRQGVRRPPDRRGLGVVFSAPRLLPHLDVLANVAFGLRARGVPRGSAAQRAAEMLHAVGLGDLAGAPPRVLSAGQAQRVALARALVTRPAALLLDEPLAALDTRTRAHLRRLLRTQVDELEVPCVVVTHDLLDAVVLADSALVLEAGRVVQRGTPAEVAAAPRSPWTAELAGVNLVTGTATGTTVEVPEGGWVHTAQPAQGAVVVTFSPRAVALYPRLPHGSPRNVWPVTVDGIERFGDLIRVTCTGGPGDGRGGTRLLVDVTPAAAAELTIEVGTTLWASLKATETSVHPL